MQEPIELQPWRGKTKRRSMRPWLLCALAGIMLVAICGISTSILTPFYVPKVYVLALTSTSENNNDHQAHQVGSLVAQRADLLRSTLSAVGDEDTFWRIVSGLNINALKNLKSFSFDKEAQSSLAIIYVTGILDFHSDELFIYGSEAARRRAEGISVDQIVDFARETSFKNCIVCIEVIPDVQRSLDTALHRLKIQKLAKDVEERLAIAREQLGFLIQTSSSYRSAEDCMVNAMAAQIHWMGNKGKNVRCKELLESLTPMPAETIQLFSDSFDGDASFAFYRAKEAASQRAADEPTSEGSDAPGTPATQVLVSSSSGGNLAGGNLDGTAAEAKPSIVRLSDLQWMQEPEVLQFCKELLIQFRQSQAYRKFPNSLAKLEETLVGFEHCQQSAQSTQLAALGFNGEQIAPSQKDVGSAGSVQALTSIRQLAANLIRMRDSLTPSSKRKPTDNSKSLYRAQAMEADFLISASWTLDTNSTDVLAATSAIDRILEIASSRGLRKSITALLTTIPPSLQECREVAIVQNVMAVENRPWPVLCSWLACELMQQKLWFQELHNDFALQRLIAASGQINESVRTIVQETEDVKTTPPQLLVAERELANLTNEFRTVSQCEKLSLTLAYELPHWLTLLPPVTQDFRQRDPFVVAINQFAQMRSILEDHPTNDLKALNTLFGRLWRSRQIWIHGKSWELIHRSGDPTTASSDALLATGRGLSSDEWKSPDWAQLREKSLRRIDALQSTMLEQVDEAEFAVALERIRCISIAVGGQAGNQSAVEKLIDQWQGSLQLASEDAVERYHQLMSLKETLIAQLRQRTQDNDVQLELATLLAGCAAQLGDFGVHYDDLAQRCLSAELQGRLRTNFTLLSSTLHGSTASQEQQIYNEAAGLQDIERRLAMPTSKFQNRLLSVSAPSQIALTTTAERTTLLRLENLSDIPRRVVIELHHEDATISCEVLGKKAYVIDALEPGAPVELPLSFKRLKLHGAETSVHLNVTSDAFQMQRTVQIRIPSPPMLAVRWRDVAQHTFGPSIAGTAADLLGSHDGNNSAKHAVAINVPDVLFPNLPTVVSLGVTNIADASKFSFRIWRAASNSSDVITDGRISEEDCQTIISEFECEPITKMTAPVQLLPKESSAVVFPGNKLPAPIDMSNLVLQIQHEDKTCQLVSWRPRVHRPRSYVKPIAKYDSDQRVLRLNVERQTATSDRRTIPLQLKIYRVDTAEEIDRVSFDLKAGHQFQELQWTNFPRDTRQIYIRLDVDHWPSAFLYSLDTSLGSQTLELDHSSAFAKLKPLPTAATILNQEHSLPIQLEVIATDGSYDLRSAGISVGVDLNNDRLLNDGTTVNIDRGLAVTPQLASFTKSGELNLVVQVEGPSVDLPIESSWNVRGNVLASLRRFGNQQWGPREEIVVDHSPPKIVTSHLMGGLAIVGQNLNFRIAVSDRELSGVTSVAGAWSLNGAVDFASVKPVPAIRVEQDLWQLTLPTKPLAAGRHLLILQAQDRAGNVSTTFSQTVEVLTPEAAEAILSKSEAVVRGKALFGKSPIAGITLRLAAVPPPDKNGGNPKAPKKPPFEASCKTEADGSYQFNEVPLGEYILSLEGLVRGMREERQVPVVVADKVQPLITDFRLDRPVPK